MSYRTAERESILNTGEEPAARVECLPSVLAQIRETVLEGANRRHPVRFEVSGELFGKDLDINCRLPFGPREAEVRGVLFGERENARVRILAFRRLASDQAAGRADKLLDQERQAFVELIAAARTNQEFHGLEPVGWVRAHPKSDLSLSRRDREVFDYFFNEPWQVGLTLRPSASPPTRAKCFLRDINGSIRPVRNFQELSRPSVDHAIPLAETPGPPGNMQRMSPGAVAQTWQRPHAPARAMPVWPAVLVLTTVLSLLYWWMQSSQPELLHSPSQDHRASAGSEDRNNTEQEAAALWKKWEEELRRKQEVAALPEQLERESQLKRPDEMPGQSLKPPEPPVPVRPVPPTRSNGVLSSRRSVASPAISESKAPAKKLARPSLAPPPRPLAASIHLVQLPTAPAAVTPAPARAAVDRPPVTPPAASAPPPQKTATDAPALAPQSATLQTSPAPVPRQEQSPSDAAKRLPVSSVTTNLAAPAAASAAPSFGRLIWTGRLPKNGTLVIDGGHASTGSLTGELPGRPVRFSIWPGDLTDDGIVLYTSSKQASSVLESPGPQNGWNKTVYTPNPHRSADISVVGLPAVSNSWKRLVLQSKSQKTSVILVTWTTLH